MQIRFASVAVLAIAAGTASAAQVRVTIENTQPTGGFAFTPFWLGFHDNSFDVFDVGQPSGGGLTEIAELGDTSVISTRFDAEQPGGVQTTLVEDTGAPVFSPGESQSMLFDVDPATQGYLNYASMLVPTNDLFVGNSTAIDLFGGASEISSPIVIEVFGINVYDAGTELNDFSNGPAFVDGVDATGGIDESNNIQLFLNDPNAQTYLSDILNTTTANGDTVSLGFNEATLLGRITIVPTPGTAGVLALGGLAAVRRRRV
jgi:hypothetical protein